MKIEFNDLIVKHLEGTLTDEEKQQFGSMLSIPENQFYLASKIDELFIDESLNGIGTEETRKQIFEKIRERTSEKPVANQSGSEESIVVGFPRSRIIRFIAVAASIVIVVGLATFFLLKNNSKEQIAESSKQTDAIAFIRHEINTTGKEKIVQLSDGSLITLADKSEITYKEPFTNGRDISLIGKAYFKVAKDKTRPFTVKSGDITTTAVGTEFSVTAFRYEHQIIVRLYEGKVVVRAVDKTNQRIKKDVYLLPGQQFIYGDQTTQKVKSFKAKIAAPEENLNDERASDNPEIPENFGRPYFMFNNQQLSEVFDDLAAMYGVKIVYNRKDVRKAYFTAKYYRSDSLETILNRIATLNNLTITNRDSIYVISK